MPYQLDLREATDTWYPKSGSFITLEIPLYMNLTFMYPLVYIMQDLTSGFCLVWQEVQLNFKNAGAKLKEAVCTQIYIVLLFSVCKGH